MAEFSPGRLILLLLFSTITVGTLLLALPIARINPISLLDLFFTATSVTCVSGLFTVPLDQFTFVGHCIIALLMQIGGLGLITLTLFFIYLIMDVGMSTNLMASQLLEIESWKKIKQILLFIMLTTICLEIIGMFCLLPVFLPYFPLSYSIFLALFHSISAFCNAGIWLVNDRLIASFSTNFLLLIVMTALILIGNLGFITLHELMRRFFFNQPRAFTISLHSKIVLIGSVIIIISSSILYFLLEYNYTLHNLTWGTACMNALFYSNSLRSAGVIFVDPSQWHPATPLMSMITGFIGSAPFSTGSGIKLTTVAIFIATVRTAISGRTDVEIKGRCIPIDLVHKAIAIVSLSALWIITTTFILLITESSGTFLQLLYEAVMAFTNVGISSGITPHLSAIGKIVIMISMLVGRIGSLTLILALTFKKRKKVIDFSYPEERVMLG